MSRIAHQHRSRLYVCPLLLHPVFDTNRDDIRVVRQVVDQRSERLRPVFREGFHQGNALSGCWWDVKASIVGPGDHDLAEVPIWAVFEVERAVED